MNIILVIVFVEEKILCKVYSVEDYCSSTSNLFVIIAVKLNIQVKYSSVHVPVKLLLLLNIQTLLEITY